MSLIVLPYIFSAGTAIVASQTNSNNTTFLNSINGGLDNTNLTGTAGITYANLSLGGNIVNADINASAAIDTSKLSLGSLHQGDIFYDNGTTNLTRLTPGTSGQFLQTQGTSANPQWATMPNLTNVLFQYQGCVDQQGTTNGEIIGTSLVPTTGTANYRFLISTGITPVQLWSSYFQKIAGINTVTVACRIWSANSSGNATFSINIGGATGSIAIGTSVTSPTWGTFTVSVSGLTNGTFYTVLCSLCDSIGGGFKCNCSNIIGFGS